MIAQAIPRVRNRRESWAAPGSSHDRVVHVARIVLPLGIGVLVALLAAAPLTSGRDISFVLSKDRVDVATERLRVTEALYRGQDQRGQPFTLRAGSAVQVSSRVPVVKLADLSAKIALADGPATVTANTGRYDMSAERVYIDGPVRFDGPDRYAMETRDVAVDLTTRQVVSGGAVDGAMRLGTFSGDRLRADLNQRTVLLEGRARLHIVRGGGTAAP
jgi:lipopolysaccharide export system protein LptC